MTEPPDPSSDPRKWFRRVAIFLSASVVLAVMLCLALLVSLRFAGVRQAILDWAGSAIEEAAGIRLEAQDFTFSPLAGEVSLYDLQLRAVRGDADPFLVVPVTEAELSWKSLLSDRPQIYSLRIHEPAFDLGASLPQGPGEDRAASEDLFPPLDIHRFELIDGSISSGEAPNELDVWWDSWQVDQMKLGGSLLAGVAELEIQETRIAIDSHRRPMISADLTAQFMVDDLGLFAIQNLVLDGDALDVHLEGHGRLESDAPFEATFDVTTDLAELLPDLTASGQLEASGMVTFTAAPEAILTGNIQVSGQDFPAELLDPLLTSSKLENLPLEGTHLDLTADLETRIALAELAGELPNDLVSGDVHLTWRRQDEPLLVAMCHLLEGASPREDQGINATFEVQMLPAADGSRTLSGGIYLPRWAGTDEIQLADVRLRIEQDNLRKLAVELGLGPDAMGGFQPAGAVRLNARVNGPLVNPEVDLEGTWHLEDQQLLEISAHAQSMSNLVLSGELLPDSPGARNLTGGWVFPGLTGLREGAFEDLQLLIELPNLENTLVQFEELQEVLLPDPDRREELLAALSPEIRKHLRGSFRADLSAEGSPESPAIDLTATWVPADSEHLSLEASYEEGSLTLKELSGALKGLVPGDEVLRFSARGRVEAETPVRDAELALKIFEPIEAIRQLDIKARLEGGTLTLDSSATGVPGRIEASIPLGILLEIFPESEALANLPVVFEPGTLEIAINDLDLARTSEIGFYFAGQDPANLRLAGVLDAQVSLDPRNPLHTIGTVETEGLTVTLGETRIELRSGLRVDLGEGHIALQPARLHAIGAGSEAPLDLKLSADLDPDWQPGNGFEYLLENLDLNLEGTVDSSLLTPFLAGGVASGPIYIAARVEGSLDDPKAELRLSGPDSSLVLPGRYRTRVSELEVQVGIDSSGAEIREGRMRVNRGEVEISGSLGEDQLLRLAAQLGGVRYRLDHGLTVSVDGDLALLWPAEGRRSLSGTINVERGSLRRNIQLERELIRMLNPSDLAATGSALLQSVDLDLSLLTTEGVRIKNNVADLRADWDLIRVRGTLAQPTVAGSIEVDPGGLVTAYGQTVRIDQGSLIFSGVLGEPPRMDFETTTSSEDPRLRSQWDSVWTTGGSNGGPGGGFWDRYNPESTSNAFKADEFATGLTSYFQNRFLQSISGGAPRVELSVQPLPLMGETDTTARVTMSYHLTPQISYVLSQNPREAEGRTDILNLQNFAVAPSLQAQIFRNDQGNEGLTLQQMLEFGGGRTAEDASPRLRSIDLAASDGVSKRRVRRATGLRRGQSVAEGADFDIEIDMLDSLARRGYPAAEVDVAIEPAPRNRVSVNLRIEPGARVDFEFTGDQPRRKARQDIIALYQPTGMKESFALETIRRDTVRALRARGFLDPEVLVTTEHLEPGNPASDRIIRVHSEGGRQVNPHTLEFRGIPDDVEQAVVAMFSSRLSRVELAMEMPAADQLFGQSMQTEGYREAQIVTRELSVDGSTLTIEVDPGRRQRLTAVQILGADPNLKAELDEIRELQPGDPLRPSQIALTSFRMEDHLREQGFANASVKTRIEPTASGEDYEFDLFFDVEKRREHRIGELRTEGLANSSSKWVKRISRLETGELLTESGVTQARRNLARTGVFQRIAIRREEPAESEPTSVFTPITFDLEEHPRYRVIYGLRGETNREAGVVADVGDLNFLGRGQTLGLRLIYGSLERSARLYWSIPRVRQTNKNLEFFLEARREEQNSVFATGDEADNGLGDNEVVDDVVANIREAWAQLTFPLGRRSVHRLYTVYKQSVTEFRSVPGSADDRVVSPFSGWQVSYDTGERSFFETSTDKITLFLGSDLSFSSENLGSDYTGYGLFGQIKPQIPLIKMGDSALVWVHNYRVGVKDARGGEDLPFFDRLFAGGEFSVRGYPTNSLGPISESGIPLGGEAMFVTNQELRFPIWTLLSGVAFFDAGNVWATLDDVESTLFKSLGAGLRADSPIGPLRLDFAYPLDRREGDPEYKIYFGLGQTF